MARLRSYGPLKRESAKVRAGAGDFQQVYAEVDARSEGRCEVTTPPADVLQPRFRWGEGRCPRRGVERHHLFKPRRSHHTARDVINICRPCHDRTEWPYYRGRLGFIGLMGGTYLFAISFSSSKFEARGQGACTQDT